MLNNEFIFIFISFLVLFLSFVFLFANISRKRTKKIYQNLTNFIFPILKNIQLNLKNFNELYSKEDIKKLKNNFLELQLILKEKIKIKEKEKIELQQHIYDVLNKITEIERSIFLQNKGLKEEKINLEIQQNKLKENFSKELNIAQDNIVQLKKELSELVDLRDKYDRELIQKDVSNLMTEVQSVKQETDISLTQFHNEIINKEKQEVQMISILSELKSDEKQNKLKSLKFQNYSLEQQINQIRSVFENEIKSVTEQNLVLQKEKEILLQKISKIEVEIEKINQLISEREKLQKEIPLKVNNLKFEKQKYEDEIKNKDEIIKKLEEEIKLKENEIQNTYQKEEKELLTQQKELQLEIEKLNQQKEKMIKSANKSKTNFESEISNLNNLLKNRKSLLTNLKDNRLKTEQIIKEKLSKQLNLTKTKYTEQIDKLKEDLKIQDNQIFTLKVRSTLRQDKLIMEFSKRKQMHQEVIQQLKQNINLYREKYSKQSDEINLTLNPLIEKHTTIKENLNTIETIIEREKDLLEKLTKKENVLENEISLIEEKIKIQMFDLQNLISLKNQHISNLTSILIQKDKLLKIQHSAVQEISKYKISTLERIEK